MSDCQWTFLEVISDHCSEVNHVEHLNAHKTVQLLSLCKALFMFHFFMCHPVYLL